MVVVVVLVVVPWYSRYAEPAISALARCLISEGRSRNPGRARTSSAANSELATAPRSSAGGACGDGRDCGGGRRDLSGSWLTYSLVGESACPVFGICWSCLNTSHSRPDSPAKQLHAKQQPSPCCSASVLLVDVLVPVFVVVDVLEKLRAIPTPYAGSLHRWS